MLTNDKPTEVQNTFALSALLRSNSKPVKSLLISRDIDIFGEVVDVRLEPHLWSGLDDICKRECSTLSEVAEIILTLKAEKTTLAEEIGIFILEYYRALVSQCEFSFGTKRKPSLNILNTLNYSMIQGFMERHEA